MYACYLKDIVFNKTSMPTIEVVKLTQEHRTTILNKLSEKKKDSGFPTITCSIGHKAPARIFVTLELVSVSFPW